MVRMGVKQYLLDMFSASWRIAATDLSLIRHFPRMWLGVLAISLVPSAYALIYLSSVWEPNAKTSNLPVAVVNLDQGYTYQGRTQNVGIDLMAALKSSGEFGFRAVDSEAEAREAVKLGQMAFAVIVPADFSANALPGVRAGGGNVIVVLSEGNNFAAAGLARRFAVELGHQVNEALNERRWEQVLLSVDGSGKNLEMLRSGMAQLHTGAKTYQDGLARYNQAAAQLVTGIRQIGEGVRGMESRLPADAELKAFKAGTQLMAQRHKELGSGLEQLRAGAGRLNAGAVQLQEETVDLPFVGERISQSAAELASGADQLGKGLASASEANAQMGAGAVRLDESAGKLGEGVGAMGNGLRTMSEKLPDENRLQAFSQSGEEMARGAIKLKTGIELVAQALPGSMDKLDGSARGLADSVEPRLEVLAPVANNGSAFAPNMIAMSLWLGAVMALYLFDLRALSQDHAQASMLARSLGRFLVPSLLVLAQILLTFLVLRFGLGVSVPDYPSFTLVMISTGLSFLAIVFLLLRALGESGKLIVILLLTLQLAAGGGVMPIELTAEFFQAVHDWLPFTWVVKALRASLFGAYDDGWFMPWFVVSAIGLVALLLSSRVRNWRLVAATDYRPSIDI